MPKKKARKKPSKKKKKSRESRAASRKKASRRAKKTASRAKLAPTKIPGGGEAAQIHQGLGPGRANSSDTVAKTDAEASK